MCEADSPVNTPDKPRSRIAVLLLQGTLLLLQSLAFTWLIDRLAGAGWIRAVCAGQLVLSVAMACVVVYLVRVRRREGHESLDQLTDLIRRVRSDEAAPDALSEIGGSLAPIASEMRELVEEFRAARRELLALDRELRQRVANRTEALERKLGTLRQQAERDPLTGLPNRRAFEEHLAACFARARKKHSPLSLLMVDVDNFKPLNDKLGHAAGDEFLRAIGQIFRSTLRDGDAPFRWGGDEFAIVVDGGDLRSAEALAERLTALVDGMAQTIKLSPPPRLSIGAVAISDLSETPESLLRRADARLYEVKRSRDRIPRVARGPETNPPTRRSA